MEYRGGSFGNRQAWTWIGLDLPNVMSALRSACGRVTAELGMDQDPGHRAGRLEWSVAETAAHLLFIARASRGYAEGRAESQLDLARLADTNQMRIDAIAERDLEWLSAALTHEIDGFSAVTLHRDALEPVPWHSGTELPLAALAGVLTGELLIHGRDIAASEGHQWPLDANDVVPVARAALAFAPAVVDRHKAAAKPASYRVRCHGLPTSMWCFSSHGLSIAPNAPISVDCELRVDPVAFVLISYGRVSATHAALRGQAISWGRKPWAAFRFRSYFAGT